MREAGLEVEVDALGNLIGGSRRGAGAARVWTGSHLDSVPKGGRYDGALGVVAGIEAVPSGSGQRTLAASSHSATRSGAAGSHGLVADGALPEAFLELHIEQGPVLERSGGAARGRDGDRRPGARRASSSRVAPTTRARRRWTRATTRSSKAARFVLRVAALRARTAPSRRSAGRGRAGRDERRARRASRLAVDARAPTAEQLDELVAAIGFEPGVAPRAGRR